MISLVAKIINAFATTLQVVLLIASFTGQLIVSCISWISSILIGILRSIALFFQIVYEDNVSIFTEDIPATVNNLFEAVADQINCIQDGIVDISNSIYFKISNVIASVHWLIHATFVILSEVLSLFKTTIILVGDTVWFIITFVPVHLPLLLRAVFQYIGHIIVGIIVDAYMTLLKFTNYLTEVPFQSFMGITSAIVIVRLCVHFRETIISQLTMWYWSLLRNVLYLYYVLFNYFTNSEVGMITQMVGEQETRDTTLSSAELDDAANAADALCVICQERQKCVLTLPCRHICLCTDCCRRLYGYQRTCPICRTFIYHTVTVYL